MFISARASGLTVSVRKPPDVFATGIKSIAQIGHFPGLGCRICGCIEQVHIVGLAEACVTSPVFTGMAGSASLVPPTSEAKT